MKKCLKKLNLAKIIYFRFNNKKGAALARQKGIDLSSGEYISFLDDDDEWYPNKLEEQIKLFKKESIGLVYSTTDLFFENYNLAFLAASISLERSLSFIGAITIS